MLSPSTWLAIAAALALAPPGPSRAEMTGARWSQYRIEPERAPGPSVVDRRLVLEPVEGGIALRGRWRLTTSRPSWFANLLLGPAAHIEKVSIDGRPATTWSGPSGTLLVERLSGDATVEVQAFIPGSVASGLGLNILGASRGTARIVGSKETLRVEDLDGLPVVRRGKTFVTGSSNLRLAPQPSGLPGGGGTIAVAYVGIGMTVGDAELRGRARLRWVVRRGKLDALSFDATGIGADLQVEGPNVAEWHRSGDRVSVTLRQPAEGRVDVDLSWSTPVSKAAESQQSVPSIVPQSVFRSESSLQIARDGEVDVVPQSPTWSPIASAQLPQWGEGLVEGSPTAAFKTAGEASNPVELSLLRYVPVPGPPMVIDVADVRVASSEEGRFAMRVRYEIRNERAAHLVLRPPAGTTLTGITVSGQPVRAARVGDDYRIPLPRSLETLEGLARVPVVVGLLGSGEAWERRARGRLDLPTVNAPIGVFRASHVLPPRYGSRLGPGDGAVVENFSRGEDVAYGLRDDRAASQADQVYAGAVEAWNNNDFQEARDKLGKLEKFGAKNQNTVGLDSNVDLVLGGEPSPAPDAPPEVAPDGAAPAKAAPMAPPAPVVQTKRESGVARRIRAQARARAGKRRIQFRSRKKKAKELQEAGRYDEAEEEYERAIDEAKDLDRLEDSESRSYSFEADELEAELEETREQSANREVLEKGQRTREVDEGEYSLFDPATTFGFVVQPEPELRLPPPLVPIVVPMAGQVVQHEFLLLEADAHRSLEFDAKRITRGQGS